MACRNQTPRSMAPPTPRGVDASASVGGTFVGAAQSATLKAGGEALLWRQLPSARVRLQPAGRPAGMPAGKSTGFALPSTREGGEVPAETEGSLSRLTGHGIYCWQPMASEKRAKASSDDDPQVIAFRRKLEELYGSLAAGWYKLLDRDRNGKVSWSEFENACAEIRLLNPKALFKALDEGNDGYLELKNIDPDAPPDILQTDGYDAQVVNEDVVKYKRLFLARAQRHGIPGLQRLAKVFKAAASGGMLDQPTFIRLSLDEGLCTCRHASSRLFAHLARNDGAVRPEALVQAIRGPPLNPRRLEIVREVWGHLDAERRGTVEARHILDEFDPRRLPSLRFGAGASEAVAAAKGELADGLGVSATVRSAVCRPLAGGARPLDAVLITEETHARRRPRCVGDHGAPVEVYAGRPGETHHSQQMRSRFDCASELAARPMPIDLDASVSWEDFEAYYTMVSNGIPDDEFFARTAREPWAWRGVRDEARRARERLEPPGGTNRRHPAGLRVFATLNDGTRRIVGLLDDEGLAELGGSAGAPSGAILGAGAAASVVCPEVIQRLERQGVGPVRSVKLVPF